MGRGSYRGGGTLVGWSNPNAVIFRAKKPKRSPSRKPATLGRLAANSVSKGKISRDDLVVFGRTAEERAVFVETLRPVVAEIMSGDKDGPYHLTTRLNAMGITTAQGGLWGLRRVNVLLRLLDEKGV